MLYTSKPVLYVSKAIQYSTTPLLAIQQTVSIAIMEKNKVQMRKVQVCSLSVAVSTFMPSKLRGTTWSSLGGYRRKKNRKKRQFMRAI